MATKIVRVEREYAADDFTDTLTLDVGEMLIVLEEPKITGGNAFGRKLATGEEGYFPYNHCSEIDTGPRQPGAADASDPSAPAISAAVPDDPFANLGNADMDDPFKDSFKDPFEGAEVTKEKDHLTPAGGGDDGSLAALDALPSYDDVIKSSSTVVTTPLSGGGGGGSTEGTKATTRPYDPYAGTAMAAPVAFAMTYDSPASQASAPPPPTYAASRDRDYELAVQMAYEWNNPQVEGILGDFVHQKADKVKLQKQETFSAKLRSNKEYQRQVRGREAQKGTLEDFAKNSECGQCITECVKRCGPFCFLFWIMVCFVNFVLIIVSLSVDTLTTVDITDTGLASNQATGDYNIVCGAFSSRIDGTSGSFTMYYDNSERSPLCDEQDTISSSGYSDGCWDLESGELIGLRSFGCWYFFFALASIVPLGWACCGRQCPCFTCGEKGQYTSMTGMFCTWSLQFIAAMAWLLSSANDEYCWKIMDRDTYTANNQLYFVPNCEDCFDEQTGASLEIGLWGGGFAFIGVIMVFCVLVAAASGESELMEDQWGDLCCCDDGTCDGGGAGPCYCYCGGGGGGGSSSGGGGNDGCCACCDCGGGGACDGCGDCGGCDCGGCDCGGGC